MDTTFEIITNGVEVEGGANIIQLKLQLDGDIARVYGRNPGKSWAMIISFHPDGDSILCNNAYEIKGLITSSMGEIKV